ncbi:MAG: hypothetical protein U5R06_21415 [candidate division KSB1 bacterium]|nr:hypothetical protein [candidate division KSB1 bacterium]
MKSVEQLEKEIESLPEDEYKKLRKWFYLKENQKWDKKIKKDSESGELDFLINEARNEKDYGEL